MTNTKETANLGKWGRLHYDYLYRNKRMVINAMRLKGTLQAYLEQFENNETIYVVMWFYVFHRRSYALLNQ